MEKVVTHAVHKQHGRSVVQTVSIGGAVAHHGGIDVGFAVGVVAKRHCRGVKVRPENVLRPLGGPLWGKVQGHSAHLRRLCGAGVVQGVDKCFHRLPKWG